MENNRAVEEVNICDFQSLLIQSCQKNLYMKIESDVIIQEFGF